ncbi:hypothetical protein MRX96_059828 [Rhipicephalus microplus]
MKAPQLSILLFQAWLCHAGSVGQDSRPCFAIQQDEDRYLKPPTWSTPIYSSSAHEPETNNAPPTTDHIGYISPVASEPLRGHGEAVGMEAPQLSILLFLVNSITPAELEADSRWIRAMKAHRDAAADQPITSTPPSSTPSQNSAPPPITFPSLDSHRRTSNSS